MNRIFAIFVLAAIGSIPALAKEEPKALTLPAALKLALERSPDLATAQQRLAAARAALRQADAAFYPSVRVGETYTASDNPVQAFMMTLNQRAFNLNADFNHPGDVENLNTKVLATYSLYNGGRDLASRQAARLSAEARQNSIEATRNDLVFEVTRSFYTIGKAREFVGASEAAVASMESNVNVSSNRYTQGTALKSDWLDAEVRLAEARENLVSASNALSLAELIFRNVLGVGETENVTAAEVDVGRVPSRGDDTRAASGDAAYNDTVMNISSRPELLAAQKSVQAAERQLRVASGGHLPRVNAFASYDLDSSDTRRFEDSWFTGVSVELDVFDGFLTHSKVAEARANLEIAREELRKMQLSLQLEARQAQFNLKEALARLETTRRSVAQAEESLQIAKERYGEGLGLLTQLLDAETALTTMRQRRAAAGADCQIARAALDKALGRGWKELQ